MLWLLFGPLEVSGKRVFQERSLYIVVLKQVFVQLVSSIILFAANIALIFPIIPVAHENILPLVNMSPLVIVLIPYRCELLLAKFALIWLNPRMNPHVYFQIFRLQEFLVALIANRVFEIV